MKTLLERMSEPYRTLLGSVVDEQSSGDWPIAFSTPVRRPLDSPGSKCRGHREVIRWIAAQSASAVDLGIGVLEMRAC